MSTQPLSILLRWGHPASVGKKMKTVTLFTSRIWTNKHVDQDQTPQNAASDQGLHCLPLISNLRHISGQ